MNIDGKLRTWGDADVRPQARSSSRTSRSTTSRTRLARRSSPSSRSFRPAPVHLLGRADHEGLLARRDRQDHRAASSSTSAKSKKPFFIWWAPAAPHREDVATTLMGRPGPDPRPAPRYEEKSKQYTLPRAAELQRGRHHRQVGELPGQGAAAHRRPDRPAAARLRGPRRLAAGRRRSRREAGEDPAGRPTSSRTR